MVNNLTPQESAIAFANKQLSDMNMAALEMYGIEVLWFRTTPQKRSTDVIFQTYTLHNVEQCPIKTKVMYTDSSYDDAALTFSMSGIEYKPTLTLEIPVMSWRKVTNNDKSLPQKKDIVFIPQTNKLWQVSSMTPVAAIGGQVTSYKMLMETYTPEADRLLGDTLEHSIEENTVNVDKLFGKAIEDALSDLTDKPQLSNKTSTEKDEYKKITSNSTESTILTKNAKPQTISGNIEADGHIVARSYYDMNMDNDIVVEYLNINDIITENSIRCLSLWVNINSSNSIGRLIDKIEIKGKDNSYTYISISGDLRGLSENDGITLYKNSLSMSGIIYCIENNEACLKIANRFIDSAEEIYDNWTELGNFKIKKEGKINLLTGETAENKDFQINLISKKYIEILFPNGTGVLSEIETDLDENIWYGIIINISNNELEVNVFKSLPSLTRISTVKSKIKRENETITRYYITKSNSYITNIRLYNIGNYDIDKQLTDLVSYIIKNNSNAIINDSADIYLGLKYYGEQR